MKTKIPPRPIQLRPGDLNVTELYGEAIASGYSLSAYLRQLIKLGRIEFKKKK